MKAHISDNSNVLVSNEDCVVLRMSLELFISNDIEGITKEKKAENNALALSVIKKLDEKSTLFNAEDMRIMFVSLSYFRMIIAETTDSIDPDPDADSDAILLKNDSSKYLLNIDNQLNKLRKQFTEGGIRIDEV
jgi:hypothetical protein